MKTKEILQKEIENLKSKIKDRERELSELEGFTLMYILKKGKHTFVLQPNKQKSNLLENGWRVKSKKEFEDFLKKLK